jgi:hypothetical protein
LHHRVLLVLGEFFLSHREYFLYVASTSRVPSSCSSVLQSDRPAARVVSLKDHPRESFPTSSSRPQSPTGQIPTGGKFSLRRRPSQGVPIHPTPCILCTPSQCQRPQKSSLPLYQLPDAGATCHGKPCSASCGYSVDICALYRLLLPHTELSRNSINSGSSPVRSSSFRRVLVSTLNHHRHSKFPCSC